LRPFQSAGRIVVESVDIGKDPELLLRFGLTIPVLEIEGGGRLDWPFTHADVERALSR